MMSFLLAKAASRVLYLKFPGKREQPLT
jgi:hypothetical protein